MIRVRTGTVRSPFQPAQTMSSIHKLLAATLCVSVFSAVAAPQACVAPSAPRAEAAALVDASARLLAGLTPADVHGTQISAMPWWSEHARAMDAAWARKSERQLATWRAFAAREIDANESARAALFYPFSGPDFLYAHTLFPRARGYLLAGLEAPGAAPRWTAMTEAQAAASLAQLRQSTSTLLNLSFFRTESMKVDLRRGQLTGVAPVLMAMAARAGFEVRAVDPVYLDDSGALCVGAAAAERIGGVRLALTAPGVAAVRDLVYLRVDLGDRALAGTPQFERHVKRMGQGPVFLKAASYLMHKPAFSTVRGMVLDRAGLVVQDDSGIPFQAFPSTQWDGRLFGTYAKPIPMFRDWTQQALREAYAREARPLETGIGYSHRRGTSNLQLFEKRRNAMLQRTAMQ